MRGLSLRSPRPIRPTSCSSSGRGTSCAIRIRRPLGRCSTAPLACAIPSRRKSARASVGVRGRDGRLHVMKTAKDAFLLKEWLAADADARLPGDASLADGVFCDEAGCVAQMPDGAFVALVLRPEALSDD